MRKHIVAGNWKMNKTLEESQQLTKELTTKVPKNTKVEVVIAPTFPNLYSVNELIKNSNISLAAQNVHFADSGAFTGEVSTDMLSSVGVSTVIIGHSERRSIFNESHELLAQKSSKVVQSGMQLMFCIGEVLEDRKNNKHFDVVKQQLEDSVFQLSKDEFKQVVLAYEPVWAIGTGETASPEQAQEMHAFIRSLLVEKYNQETAENTSILYGGSVKPNNAKEIFSQPDVDGGLIGGASLEADDFVSIIKAF
ncbi:triose-phosphate isomerase [Flavobacterium sp. CS20]|uniref:triose-phosphate isomerase n=1 Tax=Flavobacterium sp. CS20 TaxID=2775246 RepID=UPI001B3A174A|nr:triose-phosphate isomerase [Flavobacterium sp. CS20]QTY28357.1 triose-phosphate isomerase [Flavobacterium sp. CS20]